MTSKEKQQKEMILARNSDSNNCMFFTNIKRQASLRCSKTWVETSAAKNTASQIHKIFWIIMEEGLAHKEAAPA